MTILENIAIPEDFQLGATRPQTEKKNQNRTESYLFCLKYVGFCNHSIKAVGMRFSF